MYVSSLFNRCMVKLVDTKPYTSKNMYKLVRWIIDACVNQQTQMHIPVCQQTCKSSSHQQPGLKMSAPCQQQSLFATRQWCKLKLGGAYICQKTWHYVSCNLVACYEYKTWYCFSYNLVACQKTWHCVSCNLVVCVRRCGMVSATRQLDMSENIVLGQLQLSCILENMGLYQLQLSAHVIKYGIVSATA